MYQTVVDPQYGNRPNSAFVVWSTDVEPVELFARYVVKVADETN